MAALKSRNTLVFSLGFSLLLSMNSYDAFAAKSKSENSASKSTTSKSADKSEIADNPSADKSKNDSGSSTQKNDSEYSKFDDTQSKAFLLITNGKSEEAKQLVEEALKDKKSDNQIDLHYLLAAIYRMADDSDAALKQLLIVQKAQPAPKTNEELLNSALLHKRIADCYYADRNIKAAISEYTAALAACSFTASQNTNLVPLILESIAGTYVFDKQYAEAETHAKRLLEITEQRAKQTNKLEDIGAFFWARIQLLSIYRHENKDAEREKLAAATSEMMNKILQLRADLEKNNPYDFDKIKTDFEKNYIEEFHPQSPAEYLWLADEFKMRSLPLIQWPAADKAKAAVLCIHGLGLENRSFTQFGHEMAARGYSIYALDVRGFGSWQTTQGQEDVHFDDSIKDITAILTLIKKRENVPTFLLGESMGGAIALRGAAANPDLIAGVISSVPSAERFQSRRMGFSVAYHLLQGKDKPFRVGDMVTSQATSSQTLSDKWKADYKAKMDMSPKELIKFAVFMRSTKRECEKIKNTPVFVLQGLKDRLVKPQGTFDLFDAVQSEDKNLFIVGKEEHLIFEGLTQSKIVIEALDTWISQHSIATAQTTSTDKQATHTEEKASESKDDKLDAK